MGVKYYTHFLLEQSLPEGPSEFRGVIEINRVLPRGDFAVIAAVLASNFECDTRDIRVLQWARLH